MRMLISLKKYIALAIILLPMLINAQHKKEFISFQTGQILKSSANVSDFKFELKKHDSNTYSSQLNGSLIYSIDANNTLYHQLYIEGLSSFGEEGMPALPAKNILVNIDQKQKPEIKITELDTVMLNQVNIVPNTPAEQDLIGALTKINLPDQYQKDAFYPEKWVEVIDVQTSKGQSIAIVQIHPIRFNPVTKQIKVARNLNFRINSTELKKKHVGYGDGSNYLILTHEDFKKSAEKFSKWKKKFGYKTTLVSANSWTCAQIKETVRSAYQNNNNTLDFLLLIGDNEFMPAEEFYREDDGEMKLYVSDLYYACMDGDDDYLPDMDYGRLPVSSKEEAEYLINKTINYIISPPDDAAYYNTVVGCAQYQDDDEDGFADRRFVQTSEDVGDYLKGKGYDYKRIYVTDDNVTPKYYNDSKYSSGGKIPDELLRRNGFKWDGNASQILEAVNEGTFFTFHRDHGMTSGLGWSSPEFTVKDLDGLDNSLEPTILYSINCHSGKFNIPESFAEAMILTRQGGAVAVFGASNTSYSGYNDAMFVAMVDAIWNDPGIVSDLGPDNYTKVKEHDRITALGGILNYGKIQMLEHWAGSASTHQHIFELFHLFGDPSMRMPVKQPEQMDITCADWYASSDTELAIASSNVQAASVTLSTADGELQYSGRLNAGELTIAIADIEADSVELVLDSEGYVPFIKWIKKDKPLLKYPNTIDLFVIDSKDFPVSHSISLSNVGKGLLEISSVTCSNPAFTFTLPTNKGIVENSEWVFDYEINITDKGQFEDVINVITTEKSYEIVVKYQSSTKVDGGELEGLLTKANSPYFIDADANISAAAELVIEPGVEIIFGADVQLTINGQIDAMGTQEEPIRFFSVDEQCWNGLQLLNNTTNASVFEHCLFTSINNVGNNGAIYIDGYEDVTFSNCSFVNNSSAKGGACYITASQAKFSSCLFKINNAEYGGALYLLEADVSVRNCTFNGNKSILYGGSGGAIYVKSSDPLIEGNLLYNNYAAYGGGIYLRDNSKGLLVNNTLTMNLSSYGAGIRFKAETDTRIYNTILWNNEAFSGGREIYSYDDCAPSFTNCIIKGGKKRIRVYQGKSFNGVLTDCYTDDPGFYDPSTENYKLNATSFAKDKGVEDITDYNLPENDVQGGQRVRYQTIDIGAYEFQNFAPTRISLSCDSVLRGLEGERCVGLLSAKDADDEDSHTYQVINPEASAYFTVRDGKLYTRQPLSALVGDEIVLEIEAKDNGFGKLACQEGFTLRLSDFKTALIKTLTPIKTTNFPKDTLISLSSYFITEDEASQLQFELSSSSDIAVAEASLDNEQLKVSFKEIGVANFNLQVTNGSEVVNQQLKVMVLGPTAIGDINNNSVQVYPNPCSEIIYISLAEGQVSRQARVEIYNLKGQLQLTKIINGSGKPISKINVSSLTSGVYAIKVIQNQSVSYQQLIIKK